METETLDFTEEIETVSQELGSENLDPPDDTDESVPEEIIDTLESEETESLEETEEISEESEEYITPEMLESLLSEYEPSAADEELVTIWDKPISDYSASEGLLLLVVILLLWLVISRQIGGVFK